MYGVLRFSLLVALLGLSAANAQQREPFIINGTPTDLFPAVGIVGEASVGGFCTGTLISPTHVLTAAHCAEAILDFGTEDSGTFEVGGRVYRTSSVQIISSYNSRLFTNDVAILVLEEPVPDIEPVILSEVAPEVGETVTLVGFGGQGASEDGTDGSFGEQLVGVVTVDGVSDTEFLWFFDDPDESNSAPGDSGGPIFVDTDEGLLLAGIVSSGTNAEAQLGDTSYNMRVDAYADWITETVEATTIVFEPTEDEPTEDEPTEDEPTEDEPTEDEEPTAEEPTAEEPVVENPVAEEPVVENPVSDPVAEEVVTNGCNRGGTSNGHKHAHQHSGHRHENHPHGSKAVATSRGETVKSKRNPVRRLPNNPRRPSGRKWGSSRNSARSHSYDTASPVRMGNVRRR